MSCLVCDHSAGNAIDRDLLTFSSPADICERYGLRGQGHSVWAHVQQHWHPLLAEMLAEAQQKLATLSADELQYVSSLFDRVPRDRVRQRRYRRADTAAPATFGGAATFEAEAPLTREELDLLLSKTNGGRATLAREGRRVPTGAAAFSAQASLDARTARDRERERQREADRKARARRDAAEFAEWNAAGRPPMSDERRRQLGLPPRG